MENNKINTTIILVHSGLGKTLTAKYMNRYTDYDVIDEDSFSFSKIFDIKGNRTSKKNPNYQESYISHINSFIGYRDFIFVSTNTNIIKYYTSRYINTYVVVPDNSTTMKDEIIYRLTNRKSEKDTIDAMERTYTGRLNLIHKIVPSHMLHILKEGQYLSDFMESEFDIKFDKKLLYELHESRKTWR